MDVQVLNFKRHESGAMLGFCDLQVGGLTVRGCKLFVKDGGDKCWFAWPSEKKQDKDGQDIYVDVVQASESFMRHLQGLVRPQIRALLAGASSASSPARSTPEGPCGRASAASKGIRRGSQRHIAEDLSMHRTPPGTDDGIPF
jgi:hypothetical protein